MQGDEHKILEGPWRNNRKISENAQVSVISPSCLLFLFLYPAIILAQRMEIADHILSPRSKLHFTVGDLLVIDPDQDIVPSESHSIFSQTPILATKRRPTIHKHSLRTTHTKTTMIACVIILVLILALPLILVPIWVFNIVATILGMGASGPIGGDCMYHF
jgi:hypothetical protein